MFAEVLTMRSRWLSISGVVVLVVGATAAFSAVASGPILVATGNELVEMGKYGAGETRCVGGQPTGDLNVPCSPGTRRTLMRGLRSASHPDNVVGPAASFLAGENVMNNSCNFDAYLRGQCWGTFEWTIPGKGGKWEGTWMGTFDVMSSTAFYSAFAVGRGGELEGLHLEYQAVVPGWSGEPGASLPNPIVFVARVASR
jgi:hypothetical protein